MLFKICFLISVVYSQAAEIDDETDNHAPYIKISLAGEEIMIDKNSDFPQTHADCHNFDFFWDDGSRISDRDCVQISGLMRQKRIEISSEDVSEEIETKQLIRVVKIPTLFAHEIIDNNEESQMSVEHFYEAIEGTIEELAHSRICNPSHYDWFDTSHAKRTCQEYFVKRYCNE